MTMWRCRSGKWKGTQRKGREKDEGCFDEMVRMPSRPSEQRIRERHDNENPAQVIGTGERGQDCVFVLHIASAVVDGRSPVAEIRFLHARGVAWAYQRADRVSLVQISRM